MNRFVGRRGRTGLPRATEAGRTHVPLFDDFVTPRSTKYLITEESDLEKFRYLLLPPSDEDIRQFRVRAREMKRFAASRGVLLCGGRDQWARLSQMEKYGHDWDVMVIDALMWTCGPSAPLYWTQDQPGMLEELIEIIATSNRRRMEVYLSEGIDLQFRRAWYETTEFWSPSLYKRFISPTMKKDVELIHQAEAKFAYIITSAVMPLVDEILDLKVDVMVGVDPLQGKGTDMKALKREGEGEALPVGRCERLSHGGMRNETRGRGGGCQRLPRPCPGQRVHPFTRGQCRGGYRPRVAQRASFDRCLERPAEPWQASKLIWRHTPRAGLGWSGHGNEVQTVGR